MGPDLVKNHIFEVEIQPNEGQQPGHTRPQQVGWWSTWSDLDLDHDLKIWTGRDLSIYVKSYVNGCDVSRNKAFRNIRSEAVMAGCRCFYLDTISLHLFYQKFESYLILGLIATFPKKNLLEMWDVFDISIQTRPLVSFLGNWSDTIFNTCTFSKTFKSFRTWL